CMTEWYGPACESPCGENCDGGCDRDTGQCFNCTGNFSLPNCIDCITGWYGLACDSSCGENCDDGCDRDTGQCFNCTGKYRPPDCTECLFGWFGETCDSECGENCDGGCDRDTGQCYNCTGNYSLPNCTDCLQGWYGATCDSPCGENCDGGCDRDTGHCFICTGNFSLPNCTECMDGWHGAACDSPCGENCDGGCVAGTPDSVSTVLGTTHCRFVQNVPEDGMDARVSVLVERTVMADVTGTRDTVSTVLETSAYRTVLTVQRDITDRSVASCVVRDVTKARATRHMARASVIQDGYRPTAIKVLMCVEGSWGLDCNRTCNCSGGSNCNPHTGACQKNHTEDNPGRQTGSDILEHVILISVCVIASVFLVGILVQEIPRGSVWRIGGYITPSVNEYKEYGAPSSSLHSSWGSSDTDYMRDVLVSVDNRDIFTFPSLESGISNPQEITAGNLPTRGRILQIKRTTSYFYNYIQLCEVEVSECTAGRHGTDCQLTCGAGCQNDACDSMTGNCTCRPGWAGSQCQDCETGIYGLSCNETCSAGCQNNTCDVISGNCTCRTGWAGSRCEDCQTGNYGSDCQESCSVGCNDTCDTATGNCTCNTGWEGSNCDAITTTEARLTSPPPGTVPRVGQGVTTRVTDRLDNVTVFLGFSRHIVIQ
ncbi:hypothetical protein BaRGS_00019107, partial [Batillaria attramentaria]